MITLALAAALALPASAEPAFDPAAALSEARAAAVQDVSSVRPRVASRYDVDCATVRFGPDGRLSSDVVYLQSREWVEQCYYEYPPGCDPRYYNCQPYWRCYERPGYTYRQNVQVLLQSRLPLRPWEYDSFQVCLQGPWSDISTRESAYFYKHVSGGGREGTFLMAPGSRRAMAPDPSGITLESLSSSLVLTVKDKWAAYYAGEKTALTLVVKRRNPNWFPKKVAELKLQFAPVETFKLDLLAFASEFSQQPVAGRDYFVEASFQRLGQISTAETMDAGASNDATYQPAGGGVGR